MERPTKTIDTPVGKHKVVLNEWVTGGEKRRLNDQKDDMSKQEYMVKTCVVSIDGKTEGLMEAIDAMHGKDFDTIFLALSEILLGSSVEKKSN